MKKLIIIALLIVVFSNMSFANEEDIDVIEVRSDENFPPYEYIENGELKGFNIDIINAVIDVLDLSANHSSDKWETLRSQLLEGEIDVLTGMFQSLARETNFDFSTPILIVSHSIYVREDSDIHSLEEARGKQIVVQQDDITWDYLIENQITDEIIGVSDKEEALLLLSSGKYDASLLSKVSAYYIIDKYNIDNIKDVGDEIIKTNFCIAVRKGDDELLRTINEGLTLINANGTYDQIYEKWFGIYEDRNVNTRVYKILSYILIPVFLIAVFIMLWIYILRLQVKAKTIEIVEANMMLETRVLERTEALELSQMELQNSLVELQNAQNRIVVAEKSNMFSNLVIGVSHEINTPLGNIVTLLSYHKRKLDDLDEKYRNQQLRNEDLRTYLEVTQQMAGDVDISLNKILHLMNIFKSLDVKSGINAVSEFEIYELINSVITFIEVEQSTVNVAFINNSLEKVMVSSYFDALFQVLYSVVENAVVHGLNNQPGVIEISHYKTGNRNKVTIEDNGKGMTTEVRSHIMEYFYTEDRRVGYGLGLNRTNNLVKLVLNGELQIESELDKGTIVTVEWLD